MSQIFLTQAVLSELLKPLFLLSFYRSMLPHNIKMPNLIRIVFCCLTLGMEI